MTNQESYSDQAAYDQGMAAGIAQGLAAGQREGEILFLVRLLEHRFGTVPQTLRERIHRAEQAQLLRWGEQLLDATALAQIFD